MNYELTDIHRDFLEWVRTNYPHTIYHGMMYRTLLSNMVYHRNIKHLNDVRKHYKNDYKNRNK